MRPTIRTPEARDKILAAAALLGEARELEKAAWHEDMARGPHREASWWALNEMTIALFAWVVQT